MRQDEIVDVLQKYGLPTTRQTIARYEAQKMIPTANRSNSGYRGRSCDYPEETVEQYIAAYVMLNGKYRNVSPVIAPALSPEEIAYARLLHLSGKSCRNQIMMGFAGVYGDLIETIRRGTWNYGK